MALDHLSVRPVSPSTDLPISNIPNRTRNTPVSTTIKSTNRLAAGGD